MAKYIKIKPYDLYIIDFFGSAKITSEDIRLCIPEANDEYTEVDEIPSNERPMSWSPC